jgi:hypothetical protein
MPRLPSLPCKTRPAVLAALELGSRDWNQLASDDVVRDIMSELLDNVRRASDDGRGEINATALRKCIIDMESREEGDHPSRLHAVARATRRFIKTDFAIFAGRIPTSKAINAAFAAVRFFLYENSPSRQKSVSLIRLRTRKWYY